MKGNRPEGLRLPGCPWLLNSPCRRSWQELEVVFPQLQAVVLVWECFSPWAGQKDVQEPTPWGLVKCLVG